MRAYQLLKLQNAGAVAPALAALTADTEVNTEYLARKILVHASAGANVSQWVNTLLPNQNADGGFGDNAGHNSTVFDTALALEALAAATYADSAVVSVAIGYVLSRQQASGGFADNGVTSRLVTALASVALQRYRLSYSVGAQIDAASRFLLQTQTAGEEGFETSLALLALVPVVTDSAAYATSVNRLKAAQLPNGSWDNDVFTTALALRALHFAATAPPPVNPTLGAFSGRVLDGASGAPVVGAHITLTGGSTAVFQTGTDGRFSANNLAPQTYQVTYSAAGYSGATQTVTLQAGQVLDVGTVGLNRQHDVSVIAGTVTATDTGLPLAGASVSVTGASPVITGTDGAYSVTVAPGAVTITATATGYQSTSASGNVSAGAHLSILFALRPANQPPPIDTVTLRGRIVDAVSKAPLPRATVALQPGGVSATTDLSGYFSMPSFPAGEFQLTLSAAGYESITVSGLAPAASNVDVGTVSLNPLPNAGVVTGVITAADTGLPLAGATITIAGIGTTTSAADGSYSVTVTPGALTISAAAEGYQSVMATGTVSAGARVLFSVALRAVGEPTPSGTTLKGTVIDIASQAPLAGAAVSLQDGTSTVTSSDGRFAIAVAAGQFALTIGQTGYQSVTATGLAVSGSDIDAGTVALQPATTTSEVVGRVVDAASQSPIAGATIQVAGVEVRTAIDGSFRLTGIVELAFDVTAAATGYVGSASRVTLQQPSIINVDFALDRAEREGFEISELRALQARYPSYSDVMLDAVLRNNGDYPRVVRLYVKVLDEAGELVEQYAAVPVLAGEDPAIAEITVNPGAQAPSTLKWLTSNHRPGLYQIIVHALDAATGNVLGERAVVVEVEPSSGIESVAASAEPNYTLPGVAQNIAFSVLVRHRANIAATLTVDYRLLDPQGQPVHAGQATVEIRPDSPYALFPLGQLAHTFTQAGEYVLQIDSVTGAQPDSIYNGNLYVAPSTRIDIQHSISPQTVVPDGDKTIRLRIRIEGVEQ